MRFRNKKGVKVVHSCPACRFRKGDLIKVLTSLSLDTNTIIHLSAAAWAVMLIHLLFTTSFNRTKDYMCAMGLDLV